MIHGDGEQTRDFTYVANVVDGVLRAVEAPAASGEVINVATGTRISLNELFAVLKKLTGSSIAATLRAGARRRRARLPGRHLEGRNGCSAISRTCRSKKGCGARWRGLRRSRALDSWCVKHRHSLRRPPNRPQQVLPKPRIVPHFVEVSESGVEDAAASIGVIHAIGKSPGCPAVGCPSFGMTIG